MSQQEYDELLNWLAETPEFLARSVLGLTDSQLRERPAAEEFSLVEQICHLRDIEAEGYTLRIGRILDEDHPQLPDLDGSRLAIERDYQSQDAAVALTEFSTARIANVERLRGLSEVQWERAGELEGTGRVTVAQLVQMMHEHDSVHRGEVAASIAGFTANSSAHETGSAVGG